MNSKTRVLFVCLGNICRSPLAEGICLDLLKTPEFSSLNIEVDSAGTGDYHVGELPDHRMRDTAEKHGINLTSRARQIQTSDLQDFDYILAMDRSNLADILALPSETDPKPKARIELMRHFDSTQNLDVPDPYFGEMDGFENVYEILHRSVHNFLINLKEK